MNRNTRNTFSSETIRVLGLGLVSLFLFAQRWRAAAGSTGHGWIEQHIRMQHIGMQHIGIGHIRMQHIGMGLYIMYLYMKKGLTCGN